MVVESSGAGRLKVSPAGLVSNNALGGGRVLIKKCATTRVGAVGAGSPRRCVREGAISSCGVAVEDGSSAF